MVAQRPGSALLLLQCLPGTAPLPPPAGRPQQGVFFPALQCFAFPQHACFTAEDLLVQPTLPWQNPLVKHAQSELLLFWRAMLYQWLADHVLVVVVQDLPLFHEMWCYLKYTLLHDNRQMFLFLVARINFASYFQRRLSITNSEALSFNQKKERKRNWH